jgi:O-antigen/teichoic acid export membrane protein
MNAFIKALRFVGDLDDEFYDDERQRDVWNEASAVGFQLFSWIAAVGAAILPWVAGVTGAWIGLGILLTSTIISVVTIAYARSRDVNLYTASKVWRPRGFVVAALLLIGYVGVLVRLQPDLWAEASTWAGGVVGAVVGGGAVLLIIRRMRKRNARFEAEEI